MAASSARAVRWYRRLLWLLPGHMREESEAELVELFEGLYARRQVGPLRFWTRLIFDLMVTSMAERFRRGAGARGAGERGGRAIALDLRLAWRRLVREPVQAALGSLGLGIGLAATVLVVTLVRGVLLAPLPYRDAGRLVRLREQSANGRLWYPSFPNIRDWREHSRVFAGVGAVNIPQMTSVLSGSVAVRAKVGGVSRGFFPLLGVNPVRGRLFTDAENAPGGAPVALVSADFWRNQLAGRALDSLTLTIGEETYAVAGVVPADFRFLGELSVWDEAAVWLPMERHDLGGRQSHGYHTVARLAPGVTLEGARQEMNRLAADLKRRNGEGTEADAVRMTLLTDEIVGGVRAPLRLLLAAAFFVLLVTCFNLAAAVLARGLARMRELAVRTTLGARRGDLLRYLLLESAVLALPGALTGVALGEAGLRALQNAGFDVPRLDQVRLDVSMLGLTLLLALLTTLLAGVFPALALSSRNLWARLRTHGATTAAREQRGLWTGFIALQVALTLVLLCGTGALLHSFERLLTQDLGYDTRLLAVDVTLPETRYTDAGARIAYYTNALERIRALPGVRAAGLTSMLPDITTAYTANTQLPARPDHFVYAGFRAVDPGYFDALGLTHGSGAPLLSQARAAVIDAQLAQQLWQDKSPIGAALISGFSSDTLTVLGTVSSLRELDQDHPVGVVYVDFRTQPRFLSNMHLVVRPATVAVARAVAAELRAVDPLVPTTIESMDQRIGRGLGTRRLLLLISGSFAAVTLLLAALGVHAVVAYAVGRERKSAAIRMILGARPISVVRVLLGFGVRPVAVGLGLGLLLTVPALLTLRSQLFGVRPLDPLSLLAGVLVLAVVAGLAAWLPARAVIGIEPNAVLRSD